MPESFIKYALESPTLAIQHTLLFKSAVTQVVPMPSHSLSSTRLFYTMVFAAVTDDMSMVFMLFASISAR